MSSIAPPIEYTEATYRLQDSTREPRLHAFPEGSDVALCGRVRKPGNDVSIGGRRCTACVQAASLKSFVGR